MANLISKIVLTGGPCAGKTSALKEIREKLEEKYNVFIVNETATELINSGISPVNKRLFTVYDFQYFILKNQIYKEKLIEEAIRKLPNDMDCIIIYDRGCMDSKAFLTKGEFKKILKSLKLKEKNILSQYDLIIHLVTAANGAKYTTENNKARFHNEKEAIILDKKTKDSWRNHPNLKIIDNSTDFENKIKRTIEIIENHLNHN